MDQRPAGGPGRRPGPRPPYGGPAGRPGYGAPGPRAPYGAPGPRPPAAARPAWVPSAPAVPAIPPADLLAPDEELVAGRRPVEEAFVARRAALRLLVVPQRRQALERIVLHATSLRIPIVEVEGGTLTSVAGFDGHQGVALVVRPREWATVADVLARARERAEAPFVLVLDSLEDPQNVGTLLRSAEAVGAHGVIFPTHHQAPLSPAAVKASAGATEHLLLVPVDDLPGALADLHVRGVRVVGADEDAPLTARQADLRGPLALVVGSEGQGIGPAVRRRLDFAVRIPMRGSIGSLNAAVAGSVLLFEILQQRGDATNEPGPRAATSPTDVEPGPDAAATPDTEAAPDAASTASVVAPASPDAAATPATADTAATSDAAATSDTDATAARPARRRRTATPAAAETPAEPAVTDLAAGESPAPAAESPKPRRRRTATTAIPAADDLLPGGPAATSGTAAAAASSTAADASDALESGSEEVGPDVLPEASDPPALA